MTKKETAEQKLLNIIESQGGGDEQKAPTEEAAAPQETVNQEVQQVAGAVKSSGLPEISMSPFLETILGILKIKIPQSPSGITFGLKEANNILAGVALILLLVLSISFLRDMRSFKREVPILLDISLSKVTELSIPAIKEIQKYLSNISRRNIFQPFEKEEKRQETAIELETQRIKSVTKDLKLVGVSWLNSPESASALIENTTTGNTHFLKVGDKINGVEIKIIYTDRVVLTYENEELVIKL